MTNYSECETWTKEEQDLFDEWCGDQHGNFVDAQAKGEEYKTVEFDEWKANKTGLKLFAPTR